MCLTHSWNPALLQEGNGTLERCHVMTVHPGESIDASISEPAGEYQAECLSVFTLTPCWVLTTQLDDLALSYVLDSRASCSVVQKHIWDNQPEPRHRMLKPSNVRLVGVNQAPTNVHGKGVVPLVIGSRIYHTEVMVADILLFQELTLLAVLEPKSILHKGSATLAWSRSFWNQNGSHKPYVCVYDALRSSHLTEKVIELSPHNGQKIAK